MEINSTQLHCARIAAQKLISDRVQSKNTAVFHVLAFRYDASKFMSSKNCQFCLEILNILGEITHISNGWYRLNKAFYLQYENLKFTVGLNANKLHPVLRNAYNSGSNECSSLLNWLGPPFLEGPTKGQLVTVSKERNEAPEVLELNISEWFLPEKMKSYQESWVRGEELFQKAKKQNLIGRVERNYSKEYLQLNEDGSLSTLSIETAHDIIALQWYYAGNNYFMEKTNYNDDSSHIVVFKMIVPLALTKLITLLANSIKSEEPRLHYTLTQPSLELFIKLCKNRISWD
jgi:hypothetical protein